MLIEVKYCQIKYSLNKKSFLELCFFRFRCPYRDVGSCRPYMACLHSSMIRGREVFYCHIIFWYIV